MHGNCCKQEIGNNKKIKLLVKVYIYVEGPTNCDAATSTTRQCRKLVVKVKEKVFTNVEGPTNCNAATSTTWQCKNNDNNDIKERLVMERLVWSGQYGVVRLVWSDT